MITFTLTAGLFGGLLMFLGDMLMYYTPKDFSYTAKSSAEEKMQSITDVMRDLPIKRLTAAGVIGPVAAFFYCIGFYHIVLITNETMHAVAFIAFLFLCLGIICGGAYHSHCSYLGLLGQNKFDEARYTTIAYFSKIAFVLYIGEAVGFVLLLFLVITKNTLLPQWMIILNPGVLFLLKSFMNRLPKGMKVIVAGGWGNLIFVIYYIGLFIFIP